MSMGGESGRPAKPHRARPAREALDAGLQATIHHDEAATFIHVTGSLRCATAPTLRDALDAALDRRPATVVVDLADVLADDELGLWVLPAMAGDATRRGTQLIIAAPHRDLRVRLRRLGGHPLEITDITPTSDRPHHVNIDVAVTKRGESSGIAEPSVRQGAVSGHSSDVLGLAGREPTPRPGSPTPW